jgi:U3 small nucleolar RNA-associated protein 10
LILLTRSVRLADGPFLAVLSSLTTPDTGADASQRILTLLVLLNDRPGWTEGLGADAAVKLRSVDDLGPLLIAAMQRYGFEEAFKAILPALMQRSVKSRCEEIC